MPFRLHEFFQDESGGLSSTRLVGITAGFTLVALGLASAFSSLTIDVTDRLVEALEYVTIGCLLWAQVGKFSKRRPPADE